MTGPMLHILFSVSAAGTLHHALKKAGSGDEVIAFPDFLSYGPIDSLDPEDRLRALVREGLATFEEWDWLPPDLRAFQDAPPGEYRLRSTGEVVVDPDFISSWTINRPPPDA